MTVETVVVEVKVVKAVAVVTGVSELTLKTVVTLPFRPNFFKEMKM